MEIRLQDNFSCKNMFASVILVLTFLRTGICSTDPCTGASMLGDTRRTITEDPGTCGGLCDNNIREDIWYRLDVSNSGARMPESFVEVWHCGTYIPIWLNGAHPTVDSPGPLEIPVCAQLRTGGPTCEWQSKISVTYCYDGVQYFVYKLKQAPFCNMAYCAGNGINCGDSASWNDVNKTCTPPSYPEIDANPTLTGPYISATKRVTDDKGNAFTATRFSMKCTLNYVKKAIDDGARYDVIFQSNSKVVYTFTLRSTDTPEVEMSETYLVGSAGQTVTCKAASYWQSQFPKRSPYRVSNSYKFDIYFVDENNIRRSSLTIAESRPVKINVKASFMITTPWCLNLPAGSPCYPYYTFLLTSSSLRVSVCTFRLANNTPTSGDIWISSVPDIPAYGKAGNIYFQTANTDQAQKSIFGSYTSDTFSVTINDPTPWLYCYSNGDPHIQAFRSSYYYHTYLAGDFVLLKVPLRNIEVHVQHYQCGSTVTCNCGIIAREGNNVLGVNSCGGSPVAERYLYDDTNPGGTIRYRGGNSWIITLPSGLQITVDAYGKTINIVVAGNGVDSYDGLCVISRSTQCDGCICSNECNTAFGVSGTSSLFSYSRNSPPPCLPANPPIPIVPQCDCVNGDSPNRICTRPDNTDLAAPILDASRCKSSSTGKKRRSSSESQQPRFHKRSEQSSPNTKWPTQSGISYQNALDACRSTLNLSNVYQLCIVQLQVNVTPIIDICVLDIQSTDKINPWPKSVPTQMELLCKQIIDQAFNGTESSTGQYFADNKCPNQCNQNGNCRNGQCICKTGYINDDCSVQQGQVPQVQSLVSATCNVRDETADNMPCRTVQLMATGVSSDNLSCKIKDATKVLSLDTALSVSGGLVTCNVPLVPVTPDIRFNETVTNYSVYVSISNNVTSMKFSNEMEFIIYDGICVSCAVSSGCKNQPTGCSILGRCYKDGAVMYCGKNNTDPRVCNPAVSNTKWLPINAQYESRGSTTCSSSRPSAGAAILLLSYVFIKLFKESHMQSK